MKTRIAGVITLATVALFAQPADLTMKAIMVRQYGGPDVLKLEEVPRPGPKMNEALIRVIAAGVNPVDAGIRSGHYSKYFGPKPPFIPGWDVAGVIEESKIDKYKRGDAVYGYLNLDRGGGYAEYTIAKDREISAKPQSLSFAEASGVPVVALTAWQALIDTAKLNADQTVLIHGGSGGVGSFAIQIAKAKGAKVYATASTPNQDLLKQLGADVAIDYTTEKFEDVAKDVDVVLESVGGDTLTRSYGVVKKGGIIVSLIGPPNQAELDKRGIRGAALGVEPNSKELAEIGKLIDDKKIKVIVSQTFPLAEAVKAQEQVATGHTRGKIVLKVADEPK